jgi:hypothetical protein
MNEIIKVIYVYVLKYNMKPRLHRKYDNGNIEIMCDSPQEPEDNNNTYTHSKGFILYRGG